MRRVHMIGFVACLQRQLPVAGEYDGFISSIAHFLEFDCRTIRVSRLKVLHERFGGRVNVVKNPQCGVVRINANIVAGNVFMDLASYTQIQLSRRGKVLIAALNRPDARNAITPELDLELLRLFYDLDTDPHSNVMVLTGNGRSFSAGGDIAGMQAGLDDISSFTVGYKNGKRIVQMMLDCEKPIICRMNGDAIGLGATLALFSDIVIANEDARIGDPHVRVGLVAGDRVGCQGG